MDRTPPHDIELEQAILGAALFDPGSPLPALDPEHFYRSAHQTIWRAILTMRAEGDDADLVSVTSSLMRSGELDRVGGAGYLAQIHRESVAPPEQYARRVLDLWRLRRGMHRAREILDSCYTVDDPHKIGAMFSRAAVEVAPQSRRMAGAMEGVDEAVQAVEASWEGKGHPGYPTGYADLDTHVLFAPGDLVIVAGRPGMGKSAFGIGMGVRQALQKLKVAYFSLEMNRDALWKRALADYANVDLERIRTGTIGDTEWTRVAGAAGDLRRLSLWIDDTPAAGIGYIEAQSARLRDEHGLDVVVVDHLHRMRERGKWSGQREMYDELLVRAKNTAKSLGVAVVMLAQLNRGVEDRNPPRPFLSDLRETGRIEEEADTVLMLYRPEYYLRQKCPADQRGLGYVQVEKQREGRSGFDVRLMWSDKHAAYRDLARGT